MVKASVTGIDTGNRSSIGSYQSLELFLGTVEVRKSLRNIGSAVVNRQSSWTCQLGIFVQIWIVGLVNSLTFELFSKEGSVGLRVGTLATLLLPKKQLLLKSVEYIYF